MRCKLKTANKIKLFLLLFLISSCKTLNQRQDNDRSGYSYGRVASSSHGSSFESYKKITKGTPNDSKTMGFACEPKDICTDEHGNPTRDLSCLSTFLNAKIHPLAWGARKALATAYQSCDALEKTNLETGNFQVKRSSGCRAPISHRDNYELGATIHYNQNRNEIDLFNSKETDCTMFVGVAMAAAGLRITKNNDNMQINDDLATANMINMGDKDSECLRRATFDQKESVRSGDVIVYRYTGGSAKGHAVIIDKTGPDPFGLRAINSLGRCTPNYIDFNRFDFTIIESGGNNGMNRLSAQTLAGKRNFAVKSVLMDMAIKACKAKFNSTQEVARDENRHGVITSSRILRHNGHPECINPDPPKLRSEECVEDCHQLK